MKIILAGPTGFIGSEILHQTFNNPSITSLIALSRRPIHFAETGTETTNAKLKVVIIEDFNVYSEEVMKACEGAVGCIWTIGAKSTSAATTRRVSVGYTLAAARAFSKIPLPREGKFRFVFTSGILAVRDPGQSTWFFGEARKAAGEAESQLLSFAEENKNTFEAFIMRPAAVIGKECGLKNTLVGLGPSVRVDEVAAALIDVVVCGGERWTVENGELRERGRGFLRRG